VIVVRNVPVPLVESRVADSIAFSLTPLCNEDAD
jgi:hypothetical protein